MGETDKDNKKNILKNPSKARPASRCCGGVQGQTHPTQAPPPQRPPSPMGGLGRQSHGNTASIVGLPTQKKVFVLPLVCCSRSIHSIAMFDRGKQIVQIFRKTDFCLQTDSKKQISVLRWKSFTHEHTEDFRPEWCFSAIYHA